ncbi:MAG TPA: hypothetical protein VFX27_11620 [Sphingobium sp.]|nr:hypothetical protein [Sphingobium sp.]
MVDIQPRRYNEKLKGVATLLSQGGLALFIASMSRWFIVGMDVELATWFGVAVALMWVSIHILNLLQPEETT